MKETRYLPKLLLVEGLPQYERVSEAELLHETFRILKKGCDGRTARHAITFFRQPKTKVEFLQRSASPNVFWATWNLNAP